MAQKVVSKAEGRIVRLDEVTPTQRAEDLARAHRPGCPAVPALPGRVRGRSLRSGVGTWSPLHRLGFIGTGAGVDMSNVADRAEGYAVLLPADPDASARAIRAGLRDLTGATVAVIVSDSFGSPVREGAIGAAIGIAGIRHAEQPEGDADLFGNPSTPMMNRVDEIASAASILMGQTAAARPVIVGRGVPYTADEDASIDPAAHPAAGPGCGRSRAPGA